MRPLPPYVPTQVGEARLITTTNTIHDVRPTLPPDGLGGLRSIGDYSGGAANRWASYWGKHIVHGGGHAATEDSSIYAVAYEDTAVSWELVAGMPDLRERGVWYNFGGGKNSYAYFTLHGADSTMPDDPDNPAGWALPDDERQNPREISPGWPAAGHTYDSLSIISPQWSGDPKGALLRHAGFALGTSISRDTFFAHRFRFSGTTWDRLEPASAINQATCIDTKRGRAKFPYSRGYRDLTTGNWVHVPGETTGLPKGYVDNRLSEYHEQRDIFVFCTNTQEETHDQLPSKWAWWPGGDDDGVRHLVTWTGAPPPNVATSSETGRASVVYVDALKQLGFFSFADRDAYYLIDVPDDPREPWTANRVEIFGDGRPSLLVHPAGHVYGRWDWLPALRSFSYIPLSESASGRIDQVVLVRVVE